MCYQEQITTILPLIFDYLDDPFELIAVCKLINTYATKYKIRLIKQYDYFDEDYMRDIEPEAKIFNDKLLQKFKFKQLELHDNIVSYITDTDAIYLKHIEVINVNAEDYVTAIGLSYLTNAKKITLNICGDPFFKQMINHNFMSGLHTLNISSKTITDDDLQYFKNIIHLELDCNNRITDIGLEHLNKIETLVLTSNTKISDFGLQFLSTVKKLNLENNVNICGFGFKYLKNIKYLSLNALFTKDKYIKHLFGIEELDLSHDNLKDSSLRYLARIKKLKLYRNDIISDSGMKYIGGIETLSMLHNGNITDRGLKYLSGIKYLTLGRCQIKKASVKSSKSLKYLQGLQELNCEYGSSLENANLKMLDGIKKINVHKLSITDPNIGLHPFDQLDYLTVSDIQCDVTNKNIIKSIKNTKNLTLKYMEIKRDGKLLSDGLLRLFNLHPSSELSAEYNTYEWKQETNNMNLFLENYYKI